MFLHRIRRRRGQRGELIARAAAHAVEPLEARVLLSYTLNTLASFSGANGSDPQAGLVMDGSGNLYGTTATGGANGDGTVFEVAKGSSTVTVLASFDGTDGSDPLGGLVIDGSGNLFGTASQGGADALGTVFEVVNGSGSLTVLGSFDGTNGSGPAAGLVTDASGNLYGTAADGGAASVGSIFEVATGSNSITLLASFPTDSSGGPGVGPQTALAFDASGNLYGATSSGGTGGAGAVYELAHGSSTITTLVSFNGISPSGDYNSGLIIDGNGNLYGTTSEGGGSNDGNVYGIASGSGSITVFASFNGTDGSTPMAGLAIDGSGNLYGTTEAGGTSGGFTANGVVFEVTASGIGSGTAAITDLLPLDGSNNGGTAPEAGLLLDGSGDLYGTTTLGGTANDGAVIEAAVVVPPGPKLVNVDFTVNHTTVQTGAAALGSTGDVWNDVNATSGTAASGANIALEDATGAASGVSLSYSADNSATVGTSGSPFNGTAWQDLMQSYLISNHSTGDTLTLSGLTADGQYDLFLYSGANNAANGRKTSLTVNGVTETTTFSKTLGSFASGVNYAAFLVTATAGGVVTIKFGPSGGGGEGDLNGLQLETFSAASTTLSLTTPATAASINVGGTYDIQWTGGNLTDSVLIFAEGGPNNTQTQLTPGPVPQSEGEFAWNTTGALHGWYYFKAIDVPADSTSYNAYSPNWLHVVNPAVTVAPTVALTNPGTGNGQVQQGGSYTIHWTTTEQSGDGNPVFVQLMVFNQYSLNTLASGWSVLAASVLTKNGSGSFTWKTTNVDPGWYAFQAQANDGDLFGASAVSPGWVHVVLPHQVVFTYVTPTNGQTVAGGDVFDLDWTLHLANDLKGVVNTSDMTVQITPDYFIYTLPNGVKTPESLASVVVNAGQALGTYAWTTPIGAQYYSFGVQLTYGDVTYNLQSPHWLHVT